MKLPADLHESQLLELLDVSELAELACIAFDSGNRVASEVALRALRRRMDAASWSVDPAQFALSLPPPQVH